MDYILKVNNINKKYPQQVVLTDISFDICKGEIVGLIGKNGSGKTTLFNIILGFIKQTSGNYHWNNTLSALDISNMVSAPQFFGYLSGYENLLYFCKIKKINTNVINTVLETVNLIDAKNKKFKDYSLGMRQRLGVALALINRPRVLILDEPFNGIDPEGIYEITNLIEKLSLDNEITFLISSHVLDDLYRTCNRFIFIDSGTIIKDINKDELDTELTSNIIVSFENLTKSLKDIFSKKFGQTHVSFKDNHIILNLDEDMHYEIKEWLNEEKIYYKKIEETKKSMNELFIEMIKR